MPTATCHCGAVAIALTRRPSELNECQCSICRRYGVQWAYYAPDDLVITAREPTDIYLWGDKKIEFHRCSQCGCVTHWLPVDRTRQRVAINARMLPLAGVAEAIIRQSNGPR